MTGGFPAAVLSADGSLARSLADCVFNDERCINGNDGQCAGVVSTNSRTVAILQMELETRISSAPPRSPRNTAMPVLLRSLRHARSMPIKIVTLNGLPNY